MQSLFEAPAKQSIQDRLARLEPGSSRKWGKMSAGQMLAHCAIALEAGTGDRPRKQALIGRIFAPFVRSSVLGEKPFPKNSPTDPTFIVTDERDFAKERQRLRDVIERFCQRGPEEACRQTHSFLGRLTGDEWGRMMYKHLDHHFQQFGV